MAVIPCLSAGLGDQPFRRRINAAAGLKRNGQSNRKKNSEKANIE
jgi:hypothetical protein